ncbi:MAG: TonB-dependent siderophore receptor [Caulobacter sp.]|nr:TonB-dependent siderophore receptor [Caulobacter sp.]
MSARAASRRVRSGFLTVLLASASLPLAAVGVAHADDAAIATAADEADSVSQVTVEGERSKRSTGATGLDLSLRQTPQSVTVVGRQQIEDFALNDVNALLSQVVGVNVERVETDRTYYNARGFDITNFQVDGIGLPLIWGIQFGDLDTVLFERVDVIRGANGMMTGVGNPSATINYVRKRPTQDAQATASASYGSWDDYRLEADVSGPLNVSGTVTGRLVYASEDKDSYLDHYKVNRNVYYGVLSWDLTPKLKATAGYSRQDNLASGVLWGALPMTYSDGSRIDYPRSASTSADWTYWDTKDQSAFAEAAYAFDGGWSAKATYTRKAFDETAKLLYAYGDIDKATGLGAKGMSGLYPSRYRQNLWEASISGPVRLFGREHELVLGASAARGTGKEYEGFSDAEIDYPAIGDWSRLQPAEPAYPAPRLQADTKDRLDRLYGAAHVSFTDRLKGVVGFNAIDLKSSGASYGTDQARSASKVSPYAGLVFDVNPHVSLYGSYTDIFNPQVEVDASNRKLDPAQGTSYEAGVKSEWFGGKLYATAAVFRAKQAGLATAAGTFGPGDPGPIGKTYYVGVDTTTKGYEFEVSGAITERWRVAGGWTQVSIEDENGADARIFLPRKSLKLSTTYGVPEFRDLKLGAAVRWQDEVAMPDVPAITQKAYAVVDVMAGLKLADHVRASVNVRNLFDKKYLTSLMWGQSYYAAPRSAAVRLDYSF